MLGVLVMIGAAHGPTETSGTVHGVGLQGVLSSCHAMGGGCSLGEQSWLCAASYPSPLSSRAFSTIWIR